MTIGINVFDEVGTGIIALCNTLINRENGFKESEDVNAETLETIAKDGFYKGQKFHIIDTPSMIHSNYLDASHLVNMSRH